MEKKKKGTHGKNEPVEEHRREVHRPRPAPEMEVRRLEGVRRLREAQQRDEAVRRDGRHAARRHQRGERDLAREDRAQQRRCEHEHDRDRVPRLSVRRDAPDPAREREDAVARDGEDQPGGGHDGDAGVLSG